MHCYAFEMEDEEGGMKRVGILSFLLFVCIAMHSELLLKGPSLRYISKCSYYLASLGETGAHLSWASTSSAFTSLLQ